MRRRKGFSLIELVVVVGLIGIVFLIASNMINISFGSLRAAAREFQLQSQTRAAAQTAISKIRYATAIFTIPKDSFSPVPLTDPNAAASGLDNEWDYFGVEDVLMNGKQASQIVQYTWNEAAGGHSKHIVMEPMEGVKYELVFSKDIAESRAGVASLANITENNILNFKIVGYLNGDNSKPYITINGGTLAINSLQVYNYGTELEPAAAIAYRGDQRPGTVVGHIAMVLDVSGSMNFYMDEDTGTYDPLHPHTLDDPKKRINILKQAATDMITQLAAENSINMDVTIIPFSNTANKSVDFPHDFYNVRGGKDTLLNQINLLSPSAATNTGDAIRRAYYLLQNKPVAGPGQTAKNYLILMTDGDMTFCSIKGYTPYDLNNFYLSGYTAQLTDADYLTAADDEDLLNSGSYLVLDDSADPNGTLYHVSDWGGTPGYGIMDLSTQYWDYNTQIVQIAGNGKNVSGFTANYVKYWGNRFVDDNIGDPFVIALSTDATGAIATVAGSLGLNPYADGVRVFNPTEEGAVSEAFEAIRGQIVNDLWNLNGPKIQ